MSSRLAGVFLLVVAMTAVITGHSLLSTTAGGAAVPIAVPSPPKPGDCVLSVSDPDFDIADRRHGAVPAVFGPCTGVVAGEIVSVVAGRQVTPDLSAGVLMGTSGSCWASASQYAGFVTAGGVARVANSGDDPVSWNPSVQVRGQLIGADVLQKAVGRDWLACLVRPENLEVYLGSVRGAMRAGAAPAEYGSCSESTDPTVRSTVDCSHPHALERLGWATVDFRAVTKTGLANSCRALAARLMRNTDPAHAGVLDIVVGTDLGTTTCAVSVNGRARLTGSLIGIGDRPLPLTT